VETRDVFNRDPGHPQLACFRRSMFPKTGGQQFFENFGCGSMEIKGSMISALIEI